MISPNYEKKKSKADLQRVYLELERRKCKTDLTHLMENFLGYPDVAEVHREVKDELKIVEAGLKRGLFLLPRGHLKSTTITISYVMQRILRNPNIRILITNALLDNSKGFLREIKGHFEKNQELRALFGDYVSADDKWSEQQIVVGKRTRQMKEPTIQATSVDKSMVSQHYDVIIADDLVTRESISTKAQRVKLQKYFKDLLDLLEPGGTLILIGTRWHYDDLYGWLIKQNESANNINIMVRQVWADEPNRKPLFPQKFTPDHIDNLKNSKGSYEFNCQYKNEPVNDESSDFKKEWFDWFNLADVNPDDADVYITFDPAVSKADTGDFTGIVVNQVSGGKWKLLEARKMKLNPTELVDEIFYLARKYKNTLVKIGIEHIMYTEAIMYDLERKMREENTWFRVEKVRHRNRKKEDRIRALVPLFERGNITMSNKCADLEDELLQFPVGEHDDILDALAYQLDVVSATRYFIRNKKHKERSRIIMPVFPKY